ncbi:MAG: Fe-S cluster assembly scaffold protein NifU [Thermoplasmata archaeon]|nr:MAG: Fe-S cluster assembly scaffold protein NifU [Thermoplasmata archaeon]
MYSPKVLEHFRNPHNKGKLEDADAIGKVGNPICGDIMHIYIKVKDNKIADIGWETMGCAAAIATSSMITELAKGKTLDEAMKITRNDVAEALEGLPPIKMHCSNLAADALHKAIENYRKGKKEGETKEEVVEQFMKIPGVDKKTAEALWDAGFISIDELKRTSMPELTKLRDLDEKLLRKIKEYVDNQDS